MPVLMGHIMVMGIPVAVRKHHLQILFLISNLSCFFITFLVGVVVDNILVKFWQPATDGPNLNPICLFWQQSGFKFWYTFFNVVMGKSRQFTLVHRLTTISTSQLVINNTQQGCGYLTPSIMWKLVFHIWCTDWL